MKGAVTCEHCGRFVGKSPTVIEEFDEWSQTMVVTEVYCRECVPSAGHYWHKGYPKKKEVAA